MSTATKSPIDQARSDAQELHKKIEAFTAKDRAATRADFEKIGAEAQRMAASLKALSETQRADAKQHLKDAIARLEDAAKRAKEAAGANDAELKQKNSAMLDRVRAAVQSLSRTVAAQRSGISKN